MNRRLTLRRGISFRRLSGIELLIALTLLFVSMPFVESLREGSLIEAVLFTFVLIAGVSTVSSRRSVLIAAVVLAIPALVARWISLYRPNVIPHEFFLITGILFVVFVIANLLRFVLRTPVVNSEVLCASVSAYLLLALAWTLGYWLVADLIPNAFAFNAVPGAEASIQGFNGLYFSLITMCTVGYGDITPVAAVARMLAGMQAMVGLLYVAILIARLVAVYSSQKSS